MSRQSKLESFFKSKASTLKINHNVISDDKKLKKRSLSLIKPPTPIKNPKVSEDNCSVINISSDDEDILESTPKINDSLNLSHGSNDSGSKDSDNTIHYSLTPGTSKTSPSQRTPQKILPSPITTSGYKCEASTSFETPSPKKFFSPTKKRNVLKRTSVKVKRNLNTELANASVVKEECQENGLFINACSGLDDKTIFLLSAINKYLNNPSLSHLLDADSQKLLTSCLQVHKPGMRLVCRLYWRKERWYNRQEVSDIACDKEFLDDEKFGLMIDSLIQSRLITNEVGTMSFDELTAMLRKDNLVQTCKELKLKIQSKQEAIAALKKFSSSRSSISNFLIGNNITSNNETVLKLLRTKAGSCYKLSDLARRTLYKLYIIMYLGMDYERIREKTLELMLINDKIMRETFPIDKDMVLDDASVVFRTKDEFERYLTAHNLYEDYLTRKDLVEKCVLVEQVYNFYKDIGQDEMDRSTSLPPWLRRYTAAYKYVHILEVGIQDLKKDKAGGHNLLALNILTSLISQSAFRQQKKADWYAEKALILHNLCRYDDAAEVLIKGFKSDLPEEAKDSFRQRAKKIANQKNITISEHLKVELLEYANRDNILEKNLDGEHIYKQPMDRTSNRGKVKFETRTAAGRTMQDAEEYCVTHLISTGQFTHGEHWEGKIVTTLFHLLFWDIIYSRPSAPVFLSHYQRAPLDLYTESFYTNRRRVIDEWLAAMERLSGDKLLAIMEATWNTRAEHELSGITRSIGWDNIKMVATCLGPRALTAICRRLATNYGYTHSGFPDLTMWNIHTKQIKFVEVKTDTDKPSMKQIQWMQYLRSHGVATSFCYLGVHTDRQRCRRQPNILNVKQEL